MNDSPTPKSASKSASPISRQLVEAVAASGAPVSFDYCRLSFKLRDKTTHKLPSPNGVLVALDASANIVRTWIKPEIRKNVINPFPKALAFFVSMAARNEQFRILDVQFDESTGELYATCHLRDASNILGADSGMALYKRATFCVSPFATKIEYAFHHALRRDSFASEQILRFQATAADSAFGTFKSLAGSKFDLDEFYARGNSSSQVMHGLYSHLCKLQYDDEKHKQHVQAFCGAPLTHEARLQAISDSNNIPRWVTRSDALRQEAAAGKSLFTVLALMAETTEEEAVQRLPVGFNDSSERFKGKIRAALDGCLYHVCRMAEIQPAALAIS